MLYTKKKPQLIYIIVFELFHMSRRDEPQCTHAEFLLVPAEYREKKIFFFFFLILLQISTNKKHPLPLPLG